MIEILSEARTSPLEAHVDSNSHELSNWDIEKAHTFHDQHPVALNELKSDIVNAAKDTCIFFDLPEIPIQEGESIGVFLDDGTNSKDVFEYNADEFKALNCTSFEDISKVWSHECGHRILRDIYSDSWPSELGADFFVGVRSEMLGLPVGDFEKSLSKEFPCESHPGGELRLQAIQYGRDVVAKMRDEGVSPNWENCLEEFDESSFSKTVFDEGKKSESESVASKVEEHAYHHIDPTDSEVAHIAEGSRDLTEEEPRDAQECDPLEKTDMIADADEQKKTGGSYGDLKSEGWGWNSEPPREIHHMPSNESSQLERNDGPSIVMEYEDHRETASCGNSRDAQEYRAEQKRLIDEGKCREALQMDIDDIHEKFGDKYDDAIGQMMDYVDELEKDNRI